MAKKIIFTGILVIALVFGMMVLGAKPPPEPVKPDDTSAVVYFIGSKLDKAVLWDSETPIADFAKGSLLGIVPWKTTPGEHYFLANTFNWVTMKANLKANKTYYIKLEMIPNPVPFSKDIVVMRVLDANAGEGFVNKYHPSTFDDAWRAKFAKEKLLKEVRKHLEEAKNDKTMEVTLN